MTTEFIPIAAPSIGEDEEAAVLRVLRSGRLAQGPEVAALESEFATASGVDHAVAVTNATLGIYAALLAAGVEPGDEVLVPAFTFAASAGAVLATGASPVFVDIDDDYLLDLADAAARVTPQTAAIIPVHLYGLMADMGAVGTFAAAHGLAIVEDAAQAHLARRGGISAGATGIGVFSLYATKNMTSGEGGIVTTNDASIADRLRLLRNHGMPERYQHDTFGLNLRMGELEAAIARVQLAKLAVWTEMRRSTAHHFDRELPASWSRQPGPADAEHVYHQYTVRVGPDTRDKTVEALRDRGVGAEVYYPSTVPSQPAYRAHRGQDPYPMAELAAAGVLSLPVHPAVDQAAAARIVTAIHEIEDL